MRLTRREPKWIRSSCLFLASGLLAAASPHPAWAGQESMSRLPIGAQAAISGTLGRDDRAYHAEPVPAGFRALSEKHGLRMEFGRQGISVASGNDRVDLALRAIGYGDRLRTVADAPPAARGNRVEYRRGNLVEWYVNGPLGLEQGFTMKAPPARGSGPLTLALSISGSLTASLKEGGHELVLARGGVPALRYRGLMATDDAGRELPARLELSGATLRLRIDDSGARYPIVIDPFIQKATLVIAHPEGNDHFGFSVAIEGNTIVVGANRPPQPENTPAAAYVFVKPASGWSGTLTESAELNASDEATGDWFGAAVAISGDTVVVGAINDTVGSNDDQGSAYVFVKPPNGWAGTLTENAKLTASDGSQNDQFGSPVAIEGDTVVVGVWLDDVGGNDTQGSAYVFVKPPAGWAGALTESAKLTASDGSPVDQFGHGVGVSGDTVVAGAFGDGAGVPATARGSAYVFVKPVNGWSGALTQNAKLLASDGVDLDALAISVAIGGDTIFAGAQGLTSGREGSAYVFVKPVNGWSGTLTETAKLIASDAAPDNHLGALVLLSGDTVLVGARGQPFSGPEAAAYLFRKPVAGWAGTLTETEKVASTGCCTLAFGGKTIVVGDETAEHALVFERPYVILELLEKLVGKTVKAGSTISVKFALAEADGVALTVEESERLSSSCSVRVFFTGGDPSPNCAIWNGDRFELAVKTSRSLAPGIYTVSVKVFVEGVEAGSKSASVTIR